MYHDVEYKLEQYARWLKQGQQHLGYPRRCQFAAAISSVVPDYAVADISDQEGEFIGHAMKKLKRANVEAFNALEARFIYGVVDDSDAGRRFHLGSRKRVWQLRQIGYSYLQALLS